MTHLKLLNSMKKNSPVFYGEIVAARVKRLNNKLTELRHLYKIAQDNEDEPRMKRYEDEAANIKRDIVMYENTNGQMEI